MDVLRNKPRMILGKCEIPQNVAGRCFVRTLRSENGSYTRLKYRFGLLYDAAKESPELYVIAHGIRDAHYLPGFEFLPDFRLYPNRSGMIKNITE